MSVESEALQVGDGVELPPDTLKAKIDMIGAVGMLAIGLDLSRLSDEELEKLRINDMLYLVITENRRRMTEAVTIIRAMRAKRDPDASRIRGGFIGRACNYLTSLNSDPHNQS